MDQFIGSITSVQLSFNYINQLYIIYTSTISDKFRIYKNPGYTEIRNIFKN